MFPEIIRDDVFRLETRRLWLRWPRAPTHRRRPIASPQGSRGHDGQHAASLSRGVGKRLHPRARRAIRQASGITLVATSTGGSRKVIGVVSVVAPGDRQAFGDDAIRLGYDLAPEEWGKGYATEAVQAVVDAFSR